METGENSDHSARAQNHALGEPNSEVVNVTILLLLMVEKTVPDYHSTLYLAILKHAQSQLQQHHQLMDNGVNSVIGVNVQNRVVLECNHERDSVTALLLPMVGMIVMAMDLISDNVMSEHVQLTEDGAIMVHGVNVPNHVVMVECNHDVDLVLNLVQLMVARNVLVMNLKRNHVIPM
jgi:hypothetical protein